MTLANVIKSFGGRFLIENRGTVQSEDVIDPAHTLTFAEKQILSADPDKAERVRARLG